MRRSERVHLSAIIINYDGGELLRKTLASLVAELDRLDLESEILVVDNASTDNSLSLVSCHFPSVRVISLPQNSGFARAANSGARASCGRYLLFLNNDIEIEPGSIGRLISFLEAHPDYALVAPAVLGPDGSFELSFGPDLNLLSEFFLKTLARKYYACLYRLRREKIARDVDWASGVALLIRREPFFALGGFDERYFLYVEDADLGLRLRRQGYKLRYLPEARIIHYRGAVASKYPRLALIAAKKGQLLYYALHNHPLSFHWLKAYLLIKFNFRKFLAWLSQNNEKKLIYSDVIKAIKGSAHETAS